MSLNDKAFKNTENRDMDNSFCRPRYSRCNSVGPHYTQVQMPIPVPMRKQIPESCSGKVQDDCRSQGPGPIDISASTWQHQKKVKSKQRVIEGAQKEGKTAHFATLMIYVTSRTQHWTIMIFRNIKSETYSSDLQYWRPNDLGSYAVSTEQGSIASHVTAAM